MTPGYRLYYDSGMKSLLIRNLDEKVLVSLKNLAVLHNRSLQEELHIILENAAGFDPEFQDWEDLSLNTVSSGSDKSWSREDIY